MVLTLQLIIWVPLDAPGVAIWSKGVASAVQRQVGGWCQAQMGKSGKLVESTLLLESYRAGAQQGAPTHSSIHLETLYRQWTGHLKFLYRQPALAIVNHRCSNLVYYQFLVSV